MKDRPTSNKHAARPRPSAPIRTRARLHASCCTPLIVVIAAGWTIAPPSACAEGFRNPPAGAANLGRAGGRIAHVDDASAIAQNPANLVDLLTPEFQFAPSAVYIKVDYTSPGGVTATTGNPWKFLPNLFISAPLKKDKYAIGLGITTPFGLSNEWKTSSAAFTNPAAFRYQTPHFAELKTINFNPTFSARVSKNVTVGVGLDVFWSELTLKQFYPWAAFPGSAGIEPDGVARLKGDGSGVGANIGVTWQMTERQRLAITYRSPVSVRYGGHLGINNITPTAALLGATPRSDFDTLITFPSMVSVGYGVQVTDKIRVESDVEWIQFSKFKSLNLGVGNNAFLFPSTKIAQDWKDTFTAGIAGDWKFAPGWTLRGGYQFYQSPVPDRTFSPTIPDADQHVLTVGISYQTGPHTFDLGYGADFYATRDINNDQNPAFNGTYKNTVHLFALSYRYLFR